MRADATGRIAIIGFGPRGLGALEALSQRLEGTTHRIQIDIYEPSPFPGAGPNFAPSEPEYCLLNLPYRDIAIRPPQGSLVGSFADWQVPPINPDEFPSRADMGRYLEARRVDLFRQGFTKTDAKLTLVRAHVKRLTQEERNWRIHLENCAPALYDEVLLTLGQPSVEPDDQWAKWQRHAAQTEGELAQAYPAAELHKRATEWSGKRVAIRGLGLSTFDVLRSLTVAQGGHFDTVGYHASAREPDCILPFSLNGQPPFPKPRDETLDALFEPLRSETKDFAQAVSAAVRATPQTASSLISAALAPVVTRILMAQDVTKAEVLKWLAAEWSAPGSQDRQNPMEALRHGIELASGQTAPTIGYALGQVWRKWQDAWRSGFNPRQIAPETANVLIAFDEGLKRYSYGPPLSSARELLALIDAGRVDLSFSANPEIAETAQGWTLKAEGEHSEVSVIIDAVLPTPNLHNINVPPLPDLISKGLVAPISDDLAAAVGSDGTVCDRNGSPVPGLCLLGRLALGSVTAVDSLHDCFGQSADRWAEGFVQRLMK
ncbi:hypothetical protein DSM110093_01670 [Sulfitobacter sp. DSM 110093]|uniref:FAD/NAD(P)-binding protein n=1 Tax=Sulfitobacter sp. DSM 110093 TaxID=2883127 RepID=UPI001FACDAA4|nr:FAD/NAD(P)-binding domain-containing protein [Sulfitobacter sp. DSM 110093]UOA31891.1 hypothetical protein DSM110093_01670 [Sulfitobacter sp. DSM 110093]